MEPYKFNMEADSRTPLRRGWTTGACATAAAKAAYTALLTGTFPDPVEIILPKGQKVSFALSREEHNGDSAMAGVVKDAGDDPDVTHGAEIQVTVRSGTPGTGVNFQAGEGVGTVTRPGLPLGVGEPAINPVPRQMIRGVILQVARINGHVGDAQVEIAVPGGAALAEKTWNPRLGIVGGISILGTTGVVIPFSCAAWIHSIHRGIDVARAMSIYHIGAATGSTSETALHKRHGLGDSAIIDMGDFAGGMLKYLRGHPVPRLSIGGGFAKLTKLAQGHLDLHSARSQVDMEWMANQMTHLGATDNLATRARTANTALEVLDLANDNGLGLTSVVATAARETALSILDGAPVSVEVLIFDRDGKLIGGARGW